MPIGDLLFKIKEEERKTVRKMLASELSGGTGSARLLPSRTAPPRPRAPPRACRSRSSASVPQLQGVQDRVPATTYVPASVADAARHDTKRRPTFEVVERSAPVHAAPSISVAAGAQRGNLTRPGVASRAPPRPPPPLARTRTPPELPPSYDEVLRENAARGVTMPRTLPSDVSLRGVQCTTLPRMSASPTSSDLPNSVVAPPSRLLDESSADAERDLIDWDAPSDAPAVNASQLQHPTASAVVPGVLLPVTSTSDRTGTIGRVPSQGSVSDRTSPDGFDLPPLSLKGERTLAGGVAENTPQVPPRRQFRRSARQRQSAPAGTGRLVTGRSGTQSLQFHSDTEPVTEVRTLTTNSRDSMLNTSHSASGNVSGASSGSQGAAQYVLCVSTEVNIEKTGGGGAAATTPTMQVGDDRSQASSATADTEVTCSAGAPDKGETAPFRGNPFLGPETSVEPDGTTASFPRRTRSLHDTPRSTDFTARVHAVSPSNTAPESSNTGLWAGRVERPTSAMPSWCSPWQGTSSVNSQASSSSSVMSWYSPWSGGSSTQQKAGNNASPTWQSPWAGRISGVTDSRQAPHAMTNPHQFESTMALHRSSSPQLLQSTSHTVHNSTPAQSSESAMCSESSPADSALRILESDLVSQLPYASTEIGQTTSSAASPVQSSTSREGCEASETSASSLKPTPADADEVHASVANHHRLDQHSGAIPFPATVDAAVSPSKSSVGSEFSPRAQTTVAVAGGLATSSTQTACDSLTPSTAAAPPCAVCPTCHQPARQLSLAARVDQPSTISGAGVDQPSTISVAKVDQKSTVSDAGVDQSSTISDAGVDQPSTISVAKVDQKSTVSDAGVDQPSTISVAKVDQKSTVSDAGVDQSSTISGVRVDQPSTISVARVDQPPTISDASWRTPLVGSTQSDQNRSASAGDVPSAAPSERTGPCAVALYEFTTDEPGDLNFKAGDVIVLLGREDASWLRGRLGACSGLLPESYVRVVDPLPGEVSAPDYSGHVAPETQQRRRFSAEASAQEGIRAMALYDFNAEESHDLGFKAADLVTVIGKLNSDWGYGCRRGSYGQFPLSYLDIPSESVPDL